MTDIVDIESLVERIDESIGMDHVRYYIQCGYDDRFESDYGTKTQCVKDAVLSIWEDMIKDDALACGLKVTISDVEALKFLEERGFEYSVSGLFQ